MAERFYNERLTERCSGFAVRIHSERFSLAFSPLPGVLVFFLSLLTSHFSRFTHGGAGTHPGCLRRPRR
jgi:hypothetical protein